MSFSSLCLPLTMLHHWVIYKKLLWPTISNLTIFFFIEGILSTHFPCKMIFTGSAIRTWIQRWFFLGGGSIHDSLEGVKSGVEPKHWNPRLPSRWAWSTLWATGSWVGVLIPYTFPIISFFPSKPGKCLGLSPHINHKVSMAGVLL